MKYILRLFYDCFSLFFPEVCAGCKKCLLRSERVMCTHCRFDLPYTLFHEDKDNPMARQLWGRFPFLAASSLFYFRKGSIVQNLVHELKYNNRPEVGRFLGELYGNRLAVSSVFAQADLIIPVPLHPAKKRKRGYNQSKEFAVGLSSVLNIPVSHDNLVKTSNTETQTKKSRFMRYQNMKDLFTAREPELLAGRHLVLADDVLTTGSTIEACCLELLKIPGTRVSILTIGYAE